MAPGVWLVFWTWCQLLGRGAVQATRQWGPAVWQSDSRGGPQVGSAQEQEAVPQGRVEKAFGMPS